MEHHWKSRCEELEIEVERLTQIVDGLSGVDATGATSALEDYLTPGQAVMLRLMMERDFVRHDSFVAALWKYESAPTIGTIRVQVCKIRGVLGMIGAQVETLFGTGYRLSAADKEKIRVFNERPRCLMPDICSPEQAKETIAA